MPQTVYKIATATEWAAAQARGNYSGSADDLRDGFVHLSTAAQLGATASRHFAGRGDLIVAAIDTRRLDARLKWEPSRGDALFPHLYGPLPMSSVIWSCALSLDTTGRHIIPAEVV